MHPRSDGNGRVEPAVRGSCHWVCSSTLGIQLNADERVPFLHGGGAGLAGGLTEEAGVHGAEGALEPPSRAERAALPVLLIEDAHQAQGRRREGARAGRQIAAAHPLQTPHLAHPTSSLPTVFSNAFKSETDRVQYREPTL